MMKERTLRVLEFTRIRELLAEGALTPAGAEKCRMLEPADELTAARDNAVAAFKTAAKSAATQTTAALEFVAAYYAAKKSITIDAETRKDLREQWKAAGNSQKYESAVFYRVLTTCAKNAAYLTPRFDCAASNAAAAQAARDALLALGVGLTSCKAAEESAATKDAATKDAATKDAATKDAAAKDAAKTTTKDAASARLQAVLDYIGVCSDSSFRAVVAAVEKRRAVAEKMSKTA